jgi:hypothetical protein
MAYNGPGRFGIHCRLGFADGLFSFFNGPEAGEEIYFSLEKSNFAPASSFLREEMSFFD